MTEYIEREEAIAKVDPDEYYYSNEVKAMLEDIPAIDAVLVVRCEDCKWFAPNNGDEWYGCWLANAIRANEADAPKPNDFCSYGERRNDN